MASSSEVRIALDYDNLEVIREVSNKTNRSMTQIVNEVLRKIEIVIPNEQKIKLEMSKTKLRKVKV